jgi:YD repeat-containing protein
MKKFCALLVLCLLWITPIVSQTKTDKDRDQLVGPVKSVKAYFIEFIRKDNGIVEEKRRRWHITTYNTEGNISERTSYDQSDAIIEKLVYTYDANSRSTGYEEYAALLDKTLSIPRRHVYTLNEEGRRVEYIVFESNGSVATRFVYKYDAKGNLTEQQWYAHTGKLGGRLVYTFDEQGNQISETSYRGDGALDWRNVSKYDANGNRTEWLQYRGNTLKYKILFSYDSKGRMLETETVEFNRIPGTLPPTHSPEPGKVIYTYYDDKRTKEVATYESDGTLKGKVAYTYDERENEVGLTAFNADGTLKNGDTLSFNIEYDAHGNWTSKTRLIQYEKGGQPQASHAQQRIITYY